MKVYYAHSMAIYKTPQEDRDLETLHDLGFDNVVNPADYDSTDMDFYLRVVAECDALAFRALPCGSIPSGVYAELERARILEKPVFELPPLALRRVLTVEETRAHLQEVGQR